MSPMGDASLETRWCQLLKPLKELSENWLVDVAAELEKFVESLELLPEEARLRFADAAVLVQHSADIYGRKVEHLYQLVYQALEAFVSESAERAETQNKQRGKRRPADGTEEGDSAASATEPLPTARGLNPASGAVRGALTMAAYRRYVAAERAFEDIAELVPYARLETLDLDEPGFQYPKAAESDSEYLSACADESSNRLGVNGQETRTITVATPGTPGWRTPASRTASNASVSASNSVATAPWNLPGFSIPVQDVDLLDLDRLWVRWSQIHGRSGALLLGIAPEDLIYEETAQTLGDFEPAVENRDATPNAMEDADAQHVEWGFGAEPLNLSQEALMPTLEGTLRDTSIQQRERRRQRRKNRVHGGSPERQWKFLEMFPDKDDTRDPADQQVVDRERPFRKGRRHTSCRAAPNVSAFEAYQNWVLYRKRIPGVPSDLVNIQTHLDDASFVTSSGGSEWARAWMHIIFRGSLFPPLDASIRALRACERVRCSVCSSGKKKAIANDAYESIDDDSDEDDSSSVEYPSSSLERIPGDLNTNASIGPVTETGTPYHAGDASHAMLGALDALGPDPFEEQGAFLFGEHEATGVDSQALVESFEQICRRYLNETAAAWRRLEEENALHQRVATWQAELQPRLAAAEQRPNFSIPTYVERVTKLVHDARCNEDIIPLGRVCANQSSWEVCRLFVAALHYAAATAKKLDATEAVPAQTPPT
jgi:hypothetical protein